MNTYQHGLLFGGKGYLLIQHTIFILNSLYKHYNYKNININSNSNSNSNININKMLTLGLFTSALVKVYNYINCKIL